MEKIASAGCIWVSHEVGGPRHSSWPPFAPAFAAEPQHDAFYFLSQMNKASAVMVVEQGIVPKPLGAVIAKGGPAGHCGWGTSPAAPGRGTISRSSNCSSRSAGPDVTRLHSGRSRQDIGSTSRRLFLRDDLIAAIRAAQRGARATLIAIAAKKIPTPSCRPIRGACRRSQSRSVTTFSAMPRRWPATASATGRPYGRLKHVAARARRRLARRASRSIGRGSPNCWGFRRGWLRTRLTPTRFRRSTPASRCPRSRRRAR